MIVSWAIHCSLTGTLSQATLYMSVAGTTILNIFNAAEHENLSNHELEGCGSTQALAFNLIQGIVNSMLMT